MRCPQPSAGFVLLHPAPVSSSEDSARRQKAPGAGHLPPTRGPGRSSQPRPQHRRHLGSERVMRALSSVSASQINFKKEKPLRSPLLSLPGSFRASAKPSAARGSSSALLHSHLAHQFYHLSSTHSPWLLPRSPSRPCNCSYRLQRALPHLLGTSRDTEGLTHSRQWQSRVTTPTAS